MFSEILQNSQENTCARGLFFNRRLACNFIKTTHAFSWEFCEIFKNNFFTEHLRTTASEHKKLISFRTMQRHYNDYKNNIRVMLCKLNVMLIKARNNKEKKLVLTSFYCRGQEILFGD